jgi:hypothetical protein
MVSQTRNSRNGRDSLGGPLVSQFPVHGDVAASSANASVDSLTPANGIREVR